ncbi:hypothetical protein AB3M83_06445 [Microbacterium sp. 179-B 1A2 NHS]|uniref:hypothetical protein n=1 Tax=Microbacterium sp. 179-B 1A2 NHS TaxID=3142383 RepID=UPI0039A22CAB
MAERPAELPDDDDERTVLAATRRAQRAALIDSVPGFGDAAPDGDADERTVLAARRVDGRPEPEPDPEPDADPDDRTALSARGIPPADLPEADAEATLIADRDVPEHVVARPRAAGAGIAHGRADTPRSAAVPGARPERAVYRPRADAAPPVTRTAIVPPVAAEAADAPRRRRGRTGLLVAVLAGTGAIAGGAIAGIVILTGGG